MGCLNCHRLASKEEPKWQQCKEIMKSKEIDRGPADAGA